MSLDPREWGWPFPATAAVLFLIVLVRASATYGAGRLARAGAERRASSGTGEHGRVARWLARPGYRRAEGWLDRWGAPAVTLSFLTVGVQTLVNLAAGLTRMSLWRYLPAMVIGSVLWALLYAGVGFAGVAGIRLLAERSPVLAVVVCVLLLALVVGFVLRQHRRSAGRAAQVSPATSDVDAAGSGAG